MKHQRSTLQLVGLSIAFLAIGTACNNERQGPAAGSGGYGGAGGCAGISAGSGGFGGSAGISAGAGGEFAGSGGSAGISAGSGGLGGTGGTNAGSGGLGGTGGTAGTGTISDAGMAMGCPATFECVTDPIFNLISVCLPMGGMALPPECTTDADCVAAGLPEALCLMEEETGLTGCAQICTP